MSTDPNQPDLDALRHRATAILLDALLLTDPAPGNGDLIDTTVLRLWDAGLIRVVPGPEPGTLMSNVHHPIAAALNLLAWLTRNLARVGGVEREDIIIELRGQLAEWSKDSS